MASSGVQRGRQTTCPWCEDEFKPGEKVAVVRPRQSSRESKLHEGCAVQWEEFVGRAKQLATSGFRHSLVRAPLEGSVRTETTRYDG